MRNSVVLFTSTAAALLMACVVVLVALEAPADAAFPGTNGKIAYVTRNLHTINPGSEFPEKDYFWDIATMQPNGRPAQYLTFGPGNEEEPTWSADGARIAYTSEDRRVIAGSFVADGFSPTWSPDGTKIAYIGYPQGCQSCSHEIFVSNSDGSGDPTQLTDTGISEGSPTWSPDGTKIAYTAVLVGERDSELMMRNANGTGKPTRLTNNRVADLSPDWAPGGKRITFRRGFNTEAEIYVIRPDGTGLKQLTNNTAYDADPAFSPSGDRIVFTSKRGSGDGEIWVLKAADGSGQTKLTNNTVEDKDPSWQPLPASTS